MNIKLHATYGRIQPQKVHEPEIIHKDTPMCLLFLAPDEKSGIEAVLPLGELVAMLSEFKTRYPGLYEEMWGVK